MRETRDRIRRAEALQRALDQAIDEQVTQWEPDDRQLLEQQLRRIGDRRQAALDLADQELDAALRLAPRAIAAGIPKKRVAELGAVSRPTLDAHLR